MPSWVVKTLMTLLHHQHRSNCTTLGGTPNHVHDTIHDNLCMHICHLWSTVTSAGALNLATLQTDPERFGCIEGQGDYSGPDGHTPINTMGDMEPALEAPPTPQRGTGRKRGRPKGSGRGRASSKGASPSHSPKPVTLRLPSVIRCVLSSSSTHVFVVVHLPFLSFISQDFFFLNAPWIQP